MSRIAKIALSVLVLLSASNSATAGEIRARVTFSSAEITVIADYYHEHARSTKKNGKNRKTLPPGIAKNLAKGKPLPPGIAKQMLPPDLSDKLPPAADGFERIVVAGKVLLVEIATQVVHDVLTDVLFD